RFLEKVQALHQDPEASVDNPLLAFSLIKRLHSDWPNVIYSDEATRNAQGTGRMLALCPLCHLGQEIDGGARERVEKQGNGWRSRMWGPQGKEPIRAIAPRNFIYTAPSPHLLAPLQHSTLASGRCCAAPQVAYDTGDYYHSIAWLEEAVSLFRLSYGSWNPEDQSSLEDALDHLAFSYFMAGNISHALSLSREFLRYADPSNQRVSRNVAKYEKLLEMGTGATATPTRSCASAPAGRCDWQGCHGPPSAVPPHALLGALPPQAAPEQLLHLGCSYETNGSPYLLLQPAKKEMVQVQPYVALYHDFITDAEAETIKGLAGPWLQRSVVASGEKQQKAEYRISKSAWLKDTADPVVRALDRRMAALTGLDLRPPYAEHLQVVNYGLGGHYEPHFDHATSLKSPLYRMKSGNRIATVMIYLSAVEAGGSTAFIYANFSVPVVKNAALFWWNLRRNGNGDEDTLHAGCPVLAGDKWVANKWIHEHGQEFRRPCSADPQD
ncbi:P4HA3 hydroxylase, partial [Chloropsis cyanopogon]|nr:P4HA3 hydroxylase [Chloropsis cyanopogon]